MLFACACCRRLGPLFTDERSTRAIALSERYADGLASRGELEVAWRDADGGLSLGGKALSRRVQLKPGSQEGVTWERLIEDRFRVGEGVPVIEVGERLAPEGALRAEVTNVAARHLHVLRGRLEDPGAIVTAQHAYRLRDGLRVGRAVR